MLKIFICEINRKSNKIMHSVDFFDWKFWKYEFFCTYLQCSIYYWSKLSWNTGKMHILSSTQCIILLLFLLFSQILFFIFFKILWIFFPISHDLALTVWNKKIVFYEFNFTDKMHILHVYNFPILCIRLFRMLEGGSPVMEPWCLY